MHDLNARFFMVVASVATNLPVQVATEWVRDNTRAAFAQRYPAPR
jgi:hypothetical protein